MEELVAHLIILVTTSIALFGIVRLMNPSPEVNPTLLESIGYCLVSMLIGFVPSLWGLFAWFGWWGYVFAQKFYLNKLAMIIGLVTMRMALEVPRWLLKMLLERMSE